MKKIKSSAETKALVNKALDLVRGGMSKVEAAKEVGTHVSNIYTYLGREKGTKQKAKPVKKHEFIDVPQAVSKCAVIICTPDQLKSVIGGL